MTTTNRTTTGTCHLCDGPISSEYDPEDGSFHMPWAHMACMHPCATGAFAVVGTFTAADRPATRFTTRKGAQRHADHLSDWNTPYNGSTFAVVAWS